MDFTAYKVKNSCAGLTITHEAGERPCNVWVVSRPLTLSQLVEVCSRHDAACPAFRTSVQGG